MRTNIYGKGGLVEWAVSNLKNDIAINGVANVLFNAVNVNNLSITQVDSLPLNYDKWNSYQLIDLR